MKTTSIKLTPKSIEKMHLSFVHPVKLTGLSAKVTPETKARYEELIIKKYKAEDIIRVGVELYEMQIAEIEHQIKTGNTKRKLQLMQKQG